MTDDFRSMNVPELLDAWDDATSDEERDAIRAALDERGARTSSLKAVETLPDEDYVPPEERTPDQRAVGRARGLLIGFATLGGAGLIPMTLLWLTDAGAADDPDMAVLMLIALFMRLAAALTCIVLLAKSKTRPQLSLSITLILAVGSLALTSIELYVRGDELSRAQVSADLIWVALTTAAIGVLVPGVRAAARVEAAEAAAEEPPPLPLG